MSTPKETPDEQWRRLQERKEKNHDNGEKATRAQTNASNNV
jgi:hypothetical protein